MGAREAVGGRQCLHAGDVSDRFSQNHNHIFMHEYCMPELRCASRCRVCVQPSSRASIAPQAPQARQDVASRAAACRSCNRRAGDVPAMHRDGGRGDAMPTRPLRPSAKALLSSLARLQAQRRIEKCKRILLSEHSHGCWEARNCRPRKVADSAADAPSAVRTSLHKKTRTHRGVG